MSMPRDPTKVLSYEPRSLRLGADADSNTSRRKIFKEIAATPPNKGTVFRSHKFWGNRLFTLTWYDIQSDQLLHGNCNGIGKSL